MKAIEVSLVIPVYNGEKFIEDNIRSILAQIFEDFEAIYVDDGSTDETASIIGKYAEIDERIQYYYQDNRGAGSARNTGMAHTTGKYIMFLDADDFFHPYMLSNLIELSERKKLDICICDANIYDMRFNAFYECWNAVMEEHIPDRSVFSCEDAGDDIFMISGSFPWNKLYRASFIRENNISFQEISSINDLYFVFMTYVKARRIGICKSKLVYYRIGSSDGLTINNDKEPDNIYRAYKKLKDTLIEEGLYEKHYKSLCRMVSWDFFTALHRMRNVAKFDYLYNRIKSVYLPEFGMIQREMGFYLDDYIYSKYQEIIELSSEEYTFNEWKKIKNGEADNALYEIDKTYLFKSFMYDIGTKLIVYGFGKVGKDIVEQILSLNTQEIVAIIDNYCTERDYKGIKIIKTDEIVQYSYDFIIITIFNPDVSSSIYDDLINRGIKGEKISHFLYSSV